MRYKLLLEYKLVNINFFKVLNMISEFLSEIGKITNNEHPLNLIMSDIWYALTSVWNYKIYATAEKQPIHISNIVISLILFWLGVKLVKHVIKILKYKLSKKVTEPGVVNSLSQLTYYFLMVIMMIFVLDVANVPLTIFTVVGTTLALGIGLGSQNVVNNFISGIIIMIERPIKVGDIVEVKGVTGEVVHIGARCTTIITSKNINILIPNSNILQDMVVNWTLEDTILKTSINLNISSNVDIDKVDRLILGALDDSKYILKNLPPKVNLVDFNSSSYSIEIEFHIDLSLNIKNTKVINDINRSLLEVFKDNKIEVMDKANYVITPKHD